MSLTSNGLPGVACMIKNVNAAIASNRGDEPEDPVHGESQHAGSGLLTGAFADRGSDDAPGGQAARHPTLADAVAFRRPITLTRPNTVVKVVSVHLMIEQRDDSIAQFYVSRT